MVKFRNLIIVVVILALQSCLLDMFEESPEVFTNKIYLKKSDGGYYLIFGENYQKDGIYSFILGEPVGEAFGNDSMIYVKGSFLEGPHYNLIRHDNGNKVLATVPIDSLLYFRCTKDQNFKYLFVKDDRK